MSVSYHSTRDNSGWITTEIVADTPEEKQAAVAKFLSEWRVYDARVLHRYETSLTSKVKRFYKQ